MSDYFKDDKKTIFDVGCSTGNLLRYLARTKKVNGKMVGLDISRNLLPTNTREYPNVEFIEHDLNTPYKFNDACIVYSIFALQFVDKASRQMILNNIYEGLCEGGALFVAEKVYCNDGMFQDIFTSTYYDYKKESFTEKEIFDKERSLRSMLKPLTREENWDMLHKAGFNKGEMFWKYFQFEGILVIK
jgi:tRNA (cmo5U34)-methyltransferase